MKQKAIICDIDGVLLNTEHILNRAIIAGLANGDIWKFFNRHANDHDVMANPDIVEMLETFARQGYKIVFITSRSAEIRKHTSAKIAMSIGIYATRPFPFELLMRNIGDLRPSYEVKQDLMKQLQEKNSVLFAIDDESENCEMYARNKVLTMQVHK